MMSEYHVPVLLKQSVDGLVVDKSGCYVDVTFGGGGHSRLILSQLSQEGKLISFDQDEEAKQNLINDERFEFVDSNFRFLKNFLKVMNVMPVDGILADLGVSSHQFDVPQRGFSIRFEGPLDMRMSQGLDITAADVVNTYDVGKKYNAYSCPMVKKKWVQNSKKMAKVHNPYAPNMPHCGSKDTSH